MQLLPTTARGIANWEKLNSTNQWEAASWLADAIIRNDAIGEISVDAVNLGVGPREFGVRGGKSRDPDQVTLVVEVIRKKAQSRCGLGLVPERLQAKVSLGGGYRVLAIPTDVRVIRRIPVAQVDPFATNALSLIGNPAVNGSVCALVKNSYGNESLRYALTCHHVAFLSLHDPDLEPDQTAVCQHMAGTNVHSRMGKSTRPAEFSPDLPFSIDAALVRLSPDAAARQANFWPVHPQGWVKKAYHIPPSFGLGVRVFNRRLSGANTDYSQMRYSFPVEYSGGGVAQFSQLIEYRLEAHRTARGDSGGLLLGTGGVLVGMHIAGADRLGYAIPAYQLLRSRAFSPSIELVQPT